MNIRMWGLNVFLSSRDLYLKSSVRPKYYEMFGLRAACFDRISNSNPFAKYKGMKIFERILAKKFMKIGGINYPQYLVIIFGQHVNDLINNVKLLIKGYVDVMVLGQATLNSMYTINFDRSYPSLFENIFIVDCYKERVNIDAYLLMKSIRIMFTFRIISLFHAIQYMQIEMCVRSINKDKYTFVVEEGGASFITYLMYCNKAIGGKNIVTHKQVATELAPISYYDEIYCSNVIANNINMKNNRNSKHAFFNPEVNTKLISYDKKNIGYAVDMGTLFLNRYDKELFDEAVNDLCEVNNFRFIYTIHPQEKSYKEEYYRQVFNSNMAEYRGERTIEGFMSNIDILVVWWSTLITEAITCRKFVIILDFFDDRQGEELENLVPKVVKRAKNQADLVDCILDFRSIPTNKKEQYFIESNAKLFKP